jgi:hypothetical protein
LRLNCVSEGFPAGRKCSTMRVVSAGDVCFLSFSPHVQTRGKIHPMPLANMLIQTLPYQERRGCGTQECPCFNVAGYGNHIVGNNFTNFAIVVPRDSARRTGVMLHALPPRPMHAKALVLIAIILLVPRNSQKL